MATGFFNTFAMREQPSFDYEATSAGLSTYGSTPASTNAIRAMKESWGIDISAHRSRMLTDKDVNEAFLLLTMTRSHKHYILSEFPGAYGKVFTLKEYVREMTEAPDKSGSSGSQAFSADISDPYGGSLQGYQQCAREIMQAVVLLVEKLKKS